MSVALDASAIAAVLESELLNRWPALPSEQPIALYVEAMRAPSHAGGYRCVDAKVHSWCDGLRTRPGGAEALEQYHRVVLAKAIEATRARLAAAEQDALRRL